MGKAMTGRNEQQAHLGFLEGAVARVQVMQYGDLPTVSRAHVTRCLFAIAPPPDLQRVHLPCHAVQSREGRRRLPPRASCNPELHHVSIDSHRTIM